MMCKLLVGNSILYASSQPKNKRSLLFSRFTVALIGFVALNILVVSQIGPSLEPLTAQVFDTDNWSKPMYGSWTWWMARGYFNEPEAPDVVLLGSSQVTAAIWAAEAHSLKVPIDCILHHRAVILERALSQKLSLKNLNVVNCALGGAVASDYYLISKALFTSKRKPKLVVIGISPRDFIDNQLVAASATEPFRFFSQFIDTGKLSAIAFPNLLERLNAELDWQFGKLPTRRLHQFVQEELASKEAPLKEGKQGHRLLGAISNAALKVRPGEWVVAPDMADLFFDNTQEYMRRFQNPHPAIYPIEISFFSEFLSMMKEMNIRVLVVGMPTQASNRALLPPTFWLSHRAQILKLCNQYGADWCDISDSPQFKSNDYLDTVHMNARGGGKLIHMVAERIAQQKQLAQVLTQRPGLLARNEQKSMASTTSAH